MARNFFTLVTNGAVTVQPGTTKTVLQVRAATDTQLALQRIVVSPLGTNPNAKPIRVELVRQQGDGNFSVTAPLLSKIHDTSTNLRVTGAQNASSEPTLTATNAFLGAEELPPTAQKDLTYLVPDGERRVPGGGRVGVRITVPAGEIPVDVTVQIDGEE